MLTKEQAVSYLIEKPAEFGHMVGFDKLGELHNGWIRKMLCGSDDMTLEAHRASYKTTCVSVALALIILLLPKQRTMFMRKTDGDVKEVIRQVQKILLNPKTQYFSKCIYGSEITLDIQSATEVSTNLVMDAKGTCQLIGIGLGGSLTGKHYDRIFTDDIINVKDRVSRAERERTKLVYQELQNIKNRGGRIVNTLTPWHIEDASTLMPKPEIWDCYSTGLMTEEEIAHVKERMAPSLFAANYELRHIPSDDVIFTDPKTGAEIDNVMQGECHTDAAYYGEDFTAFSALNIHDGKIYVYGRIWRKHVDDCMDAICADVQRLMLGRMYMENNADKGYSARALRERGVRVAGYHEKQNKFIKIVTYLKTAWPDIVFCEGTDEGYINQICDFTEDAEHDDAADSLSSLLRRSRIVKQIGEKYVSPFEA